MPAGVEPTVKLTPLLAIPPTVTTTLPVAAPRRTGATMLVALQLVVLAAVPLKVTAAVVVPKLAPVMVTAVPTGPVVGFRLVMAGADEVTVKFTPLLAIPPTVTTTLPVVAPPGTDATMLVALQLVVLAVVPLKVTAPVVPKLVPVMVTAVPTGPEVGFRLVIVGAVPPPPLAARNAPSVAPHTSDVPNVAVADMVPAAAWIWSSVISFVFGDAGTRSSILYPLPAVTLAGFAIEMAANSKSPLVVVVAFPLLTETPLPCAPAVPSSEFVVATPAYSAIANRRAPATLLATVTVLTPPEM